MEARNRRKVLAVLAGGLVLGVGAAVTLAAWQDSEFATGTFTAGAFDLEGSTDNVTYASHDVSPGETLTFSAGYDAMAPGDTVFEAFWVRLTDSTTVDGTLVAESLTPGTAGNEANLSWGVYALAPDATCDAATAIGMAFASGDDLSTINEPKSTVTLTANAAGTEGTPIQLCFAVTAGEDLVQGDSATATWQFLATQVE